MSAKKINDLGNDKISTLLLRLAVPAITAQIINALYNIVDRMYIGRIPGGEGALALTGVGLTFPIITLISAFGGLIGMGGAPCTSIKLGEKDFEGAERILANCFVSLLGLAAVLTVFFQLFMEPLLYLFGASDNTLPYAMSYLRIYTAGTVFVMLSMGMNSFITSQGFSKVSMTTILIGAVTNIILDPIFIFGFGLGVRGAALATILSQSVSAVWVLRFLFGKRTTLRIRREYMGFDWSVMSPVLALGLSPFIMMSTESLVNIALNSSLQKYGGDIAVGAMTIISSVSMMGMMPIQGITQGGQPIIGYNYGAGNQDRVRKTFRLVLLSAMLYAVGLWAVAQYAPQVLTMIFTSDPKLAEFASGAMRIHMGAIFMMGAQIACQQTFMALGQAKTSLLLALLRKVVILIPLVYLLPGVFGFGLKGIFMATPVADVLATLTTVVVFIFSFGKILARGPAGKLSK